MHSALWVRFTFRVPVFAALITHLQKFLGRRTKKGHHLGEVLFVIEQTILFSTKEVATFEEIPYLNNGDSG